MTQERRRKHVFARTRDSHESNQLTTAHSQFTIGFHVSVHFLILLLIGYMKIARSFGLTTRASQID